MQNDVTTKLTVAIGTLREEMGYEINVDMCWWHLLIRS